MSLLRTGGAVNALRWLAACQAAQGDFTLAKMHGLGDTDDRLRASLDARESAAYERIRAEKGSR